MNMLSVILLIFNFLTLSESPAPHIYNEETWKDAAAFLKDGMNQKAKPCENFFEHVCGNYDKESKTEFQTTLERKNLLHVKQLTEAIEKIDSTEPKTPEYKKYVKNFYDQCVALNNNTDWEKDLYNAIASRIGHLSLAIPNNNISKTPNERQAWSLAGRVAKEFGRPVFASWITPNKMALQTNYTIYPVDAFMLVCNASLKDSSLANALNLIQMFGAEESAENSKSSQNVRANISVLCSDLKQASSFEGVEKNLTILHSKDFLTVAPNFHWKEFLEGVIPEELLSHFLSVNNTKDVKAYPMSLFVLDRIGAVFQKHSLDAIHTLTFLTILAEWRYASTEDCFVHLMPHFGPALAKIYFEHKGKNASQWRDEIILLKRNIFASFTFLLNGADWLDANDKEKLQKKVDVIKFYPSLPDWIDNETEVTNRVSKYDNNANFFQNDYSGRKNAQKNMYQRIANGVFDFDFEVVQFDFEAGAYYFEPYRTITMQLGLAFPPAFDIDYPISVKYGVLGVALGHELMHAFDSNYIHFPLNENHKIKDLAMQRYKEQHQCLSTQFGAYCRADKNLCVSGNLTLAENIADSAGIKIAYTAFKILTQMLSIDPPIPGMLNYTHEQLFFIAFARVWCSKGFHEKQYADVHAPNIARVDVALRNVPMFARAFGCEVGSKYAPLTPCSIWADVANPASVFY